MSSPTHHDYLSLLQSIARVSVKMSGPFAENWAALCRRAKLPEHDNWEDLTWDELVLVHAYLLECQARLADKWIDRVEHMKVNKEA